MRSASTFAEQRRPVKTDSHGESSGVPQQGLDEPPPFVARAAVETAYDPKRLRRGALGSAADADEAAT